MIEQIDRKINIDPLCDLSMEELKLLYGIECEFNFSLYSHINKRNNYKDFCELFGKDYVAQSIDEINENTICYVGELIINKSLPTYNLKYIIGDLRYGLKEVNNLENLESIIGEGLFIKLTSAEGLENLHIITQIACFQKLKTARGLDNLQKIGGIADFDKLESAEGLYSLQYVGGYANFRNLKSTKGLEKLKEICGGVSYNDNFNIDYYKELDNKKSRKNIQYINPFINLFNKIKLIKKNLKKENNKKLK